MKKFLSLLLLPLLSIVCLFGCGNEKTSTDVKKLYESMISMCYKDVKTNNIFSDINNPNTIVIKYTEDIEMAIDNVNPITDIQKRYKSIAYQQKILNYIFNYYENNNVDFYKVMSSIKNPKNEIKDLYGSLENLKNKLSTFLNSYDMFVDATNDGISNVMEFTLTNYAYELNKLIDASFNFVNKFSNIYEKYCLENFETNNEKNLQVKIDNTYLDIAYLVYLENFKIFNYSVGDKGLCDLVSVVASESSKYNLIGDLNVPKKLSTYVKTNLLEGSTDYTKVLDLINDYKYSQEVFNQQFKTYQKIYNIEDVYKRVQHLFGLVNGVDYDSYLASLSNSSRNNIIMMDNFRDNIYRKLVDNLSLIVE